MTESPTSNPSEWVDRHGDALFAYALLQVGDAEAAEELLQRTLLAALESRHSFRGESSERTWLMAILKNKIRDSFRRRPHRSLPDESEALKELFTAAGKWKRNPRPWPGNPEAEVSSAEFWAVLRRCLEGLGPQMQGAFCLREFHGLETPEICKVLAVSVTNLWTLLHRARLQLRECLQRHWVGDEREDRRR